MEKLCWSLHHNGKILLEFDKFVIFCLAFLIHAIDVWISGSKPLRCMHKDMHAHTCVHTHTHTQNLIHTHQLSVISSCITNHLEIQRLKSNDHLFAHDFLGWSFELGSADPFFCWSQLWFVVIWLGDPRWSHLHAYGLFWW